jgi:hypothetical protein
VRWLVLIGAAQVVAGLAWPSGALVVSDDAGRLLWRLAAAEGSEVVLQYTNSLYLAPTWERFRVQGGRLHLVEVISAREAVLEYGRFPPPYRRQGSRFVASVSGVVLDLLPLRVGERGRPVLHVGRRTIPLYEAGVGTGLRITIRRTPRLVLWVGGGTP